MHCRRPIFFFKSILDKVVEFSLLTHAACLGNVKDYFEGHGTCLPAITALLLTRAIQSCNARIVLLISFTPSSIFIWAIIIHENTINLAFLDKSNWTWMQKKSVNLFPEHFIKTTIKWFSILSFVILFLAPKGAQTAIVSNNWSATWYRLMLMIPRNADVDDSDADTDDELLSEWSDKQISMWADESFFWDIANLSEPIAIWFIIPLPVPNWASAKAQFIPNFSLNTKFFFEHQTLKIIIGQSVFVYLTLSLSLYLCICLFVFVFSSPSSLRHWAATFNNFDYV